MTALVVLPSSERVIIATAASMVAMSVSSRSVERQFQLSHGDMVRSLGAFPDGERVLARVDTGTGGLRLKVWVVSSGEVVEEYERPELTAVRTIALMPGGERLLVVSRGGWDPSTLKLFSLSSWQVMGTFDWPYGEVSVSAVAALPDGERVIISHGQGDIGLWSVESGLFLRSLQPCDMSVEAIAVVPGGDYFLVNTYTRTWIYNMRTGLCGQPDFATCEFPMALAVFPDGELFLQGTRLGEVNVGRIGQTTRPLQVCADLQDGGALRVTCTNLGGDDLCAFDMDAARHVEQLLTRIGQEVPETKGVEWRPIVGDLPLDECGGRQTLTELFFGQEAEATRRRAELLRKNEMRRAQEDETIAAWISRTAKAIRPNDAEAYARLFSEFGCTKVSDLPALAPTFDGTVGCQIPKIIHRRLIKGQVQAIV